MNRRELIVRTRQLVDEGDRLAASPTLGGLQVWLQRSDDLLKAAWGEMDRYHLAWLLVGKPKRIVRGRPMNAEEEAAYVRDVAAQKTAALRMSLDAVERQGMPYVGETSDPGEAGNAGTAGDAGKPGDAGKAGGRSAGSLDRPPDRAGLPAEAGLAERLAEARRSAAEHRDHDRPRAPRPPRMSR
ncbi:MAG TPA: hypothetical protein VFR14_00585 [Candidatus Limnocylindrales bacterium]|nr:hypothetical protein [Candidatus Limnocylindrales bacterium]